MLWAWMAPPIHGVIALTKSGDRVHAYLGNEADNFFTAAFLLVGLVVALAVVCAVLVWQWRAHRGPVLVAALAMGSAAAAGAAAGVGALLVREPVTNIIDIAGAPISPEDRAHYVTEAPPVFFAHTPLLIATSILFPAAMAALTYALIAVSTSRDDLGAWPPVEPVLPASGDSGRRSACRPSSTSAVITAAESRWIFQPCAPLSVVLPFPPGPPGPPDLPPPADTGGFTCAASAGAAGGIPIPPPPPPPPRIGCAVAAVAAVAAEEARGGSCAAVATRTAGGIPTVRTGCGAAAVAASVPWPSDRTCARRDQHQPPRQR